MIRLIVDTSCSIKANELSEYRIDGLIPLKILLNGKEYTDDTIDIDSYWKEFLASSEFPKTSLPNLVEAEEKVLSYTDNGDDVIVMTISSFLSGENNALHMLFDENPHVRIIDSLGCVGMLRILISDVINKYRDSLSIDEVVKKVTDFIPRLKVAAVPETLEYLYKGGRLSKLEYIAGSILSIKPILNIENGKIKSFAKKIGLRKAKRYLLELLTEEADLNYPIVPSYSYNDENLVDIINQASNEIKSKLTVEDNLIPSIASHWGPNCFGFIYVVKEK